MLQARSAIVALLAAMAIYGSNFGFTRLATLQGMTPSDLVALRFIVAGPLMLPVFLIRGWRTCAGLGWRRGIALAVTGGASMSLVMNTGLSMAPAAHGATIGPGTVTVIGILYGIAASRMRPRTAVLVGLAITVCGLAAIAIAGATSGGGNVPLGDACFFLGGVLWSFYPVMLHRWRVAPMTSAAVVSVLSMAYLPIYVFGQPSHPLSLPLGTLLFQAFFQGILNVVIALWLWGYAVRVLGTERTQFFPPLIPVLGTLLAIPVLGEVPKPLQALGLAMIVAGILISIIGGRRPASTRP